MRSRTGAVLAALSVISLAACGGSSKPGVSSTQGGNAGALSAEARSAATGDIPDNQSFLVFKNSAAGYSIKYPEGWARTGSGRDVSFRDKNNVVHILIGAGAPPSATTVAAALDEERARTRSLRAGAPKPITLRGGRGMKVTYTTLSRPNPVTGKRVKLTVDRYVLGRRGRLATVDLGTPVGVDNVDAYRLMAESFRWG